MRDFRRQSAFQMESRRQVLDQEDEEELEEEERVIGPRGIPQHPWEEPRDMMVFSVFPLHGSRWYCLTVKFHYLHR